MNSNHRFLPPIAYSSYLFPNPAYFENVFIENLKLTVRGFFHNYQITDLPQLPRGFPSFPLYTHHLGTFHYDGYLYYFNHHYEIFYFLNFCYCNNEVEPRTKTYEEKKDDVMKCYNQSAGSKNPNNAAGPSNSNYSNVNDYKQLVNIAGKRNYFENKATTEQTTIEMDTCETLQTTNRTKTNTSQFQESYNKNLKNQNIGKINQNAVTTNQELAPHSSTTRIHPQKGYKETSFIEELTADHRSAARSTPKQQNAQKPTTTSETHSGNTKKSNSNKLSIYKNDQACISSVQKQCKENNLKGPDDFRAQVQIKKDEIAIREANTKKSAVNQICQVIHKQQSKTKYGQNLTVCQELGSSYVDSTKHELSESSEPNYSGCKRYDNNENKPEASIVQNRIRTFSNNDVNSDKKNDYIDQKAKNKKEINGASIKNTSEEIENITEGIEKINLNDNLITEGIEKMKSNDLKIVNSGDRGNIRDENEKDKKIKKKYQQEVNAKIELVNATPKYEQNLSKSEENIQKIVNRDYEQTELMSNQVENSLEKISSVANEIQTLLDEENDITKVKNKISVIITESICAKAAVQTLKDNPVQIIQNETAEDNMLEDPDSKMSENNGRAVDKDDLKEIRTKTKKYETTSKEFDTGIHYAQPVISDPDYESKIKQKNKFADEKLQNSKNVSENVKKTEQRNRYEEEQNKKLSKLKLEQHEDPTNKENLYYNDASKETGNILGPNEEQTETHSETTAEKFSNMSHNEVLQRTKEVFKQNEEPIERRFQEETTTSEVVDFPNSLNSNETCNEIFSRNCKEQPRKFNVHSEARREMETKDLKGNFEHFQEKVHFESPQFKAEESAQNLNDSISNHQETEKSMVNNNQYEENQMQDENFKRKMMEDKPKRIEEALSQIERLRSEAEKLIKKVDEFEGDDSDKNFIYLDEMITRVLLKLDNVETENDKDLRMKRKECIKFTKQGLNTLREKGQL